MKLLIFTPTWIDPATGEDAIHPECEAAIKSQVLRDDCEFDWHVTADNPFPIGDHKNVLHQYRQARDYFLRGDWDALLTIEHDNVLPDRDAVQRLIDTPGDVVYAPYTLRHGKPTLSTWQYIGDRNLGSSLSQYPRELRRARQVVVWRVCGAGMGCTLFRRSAIEAIPFDESSARNPCPDLGFATKALRAGLLSHARMDVPVWHYSDGYWIHPYEGGPKVKYIALQNVNILVNDQTMKLTAGQEITLDPMLARDWIRGGYLQPVATIEQAIMDLPEQADAPAQAAPVTARRRPRKAD